MVVFNLIVVPLLLKSFSDFCYVFFYFLFFQFLKKFVDFNLFLDIFNSILVKLEILLHFINEFHYIRISFAFRPFILSRSTYCLYYFAKIIDYKSRLTTRLLFLNQKLANFKVLAHSQFFIHCIFVLQH